MKNLLTAFCLTCGVLAPVAAQAAPVSQLSRSVKKYGGFKAGQQFTFRISDKDVEKVAGSVPNEVPNFREGEKVKFTIGKKGQLTARDGVFIPLEDKHRYRNEYERIGSRPTKLTSYATIYKDWKGRPKQGKLVFRITSFDNFFPMSYEVTYRLRK